MKKVVFIGNCGHAGQAFETLNNRTDVSICGFAVGSEHEDAKSFGFSDVPCFDSYIEMLDTVKPDLAVISPVFGLTGSVILECTKRGIDVFSEKPVAASLEELETVKQAVLSSGIRFGAMHYLRVSPAFWLGARLVKEGKIGEVRMLTAQKSYRYGTRPAWYSDRDLFTGIIPWIGIHAIDWIYAFSGKRFLSVDAECFGTPERAALCRFSMENDVMAAINLDYYRPALAPTHDDDRIRVAGTEGVLEVREGKVFLMNGEGCVTLTPEEAPELLDSFLDGWEIVPAEDVFYLTRVALCARLAADRGERVEIEVKNG